MRVIIKLFVILGLSLYSNGVPQGPIRNATAERIIGGEEVDIADYPYHVEVLYLNMHFCGGALISDRWVVTGAQCTQIAPDIYVYTIRAGTSYRETGGQIRGVIKVVNHPNYNQYLLYDYDISLLQISRSFDSSPLIQIISLPESYSVLDVGETAVVTGWGWVSSSGGPTDVLHAVRIPILSTTTCVNSYGSNVLSERMICAGSPYGGRDACIDDAGGPLVVRGAVVGLVSWGYGCAQAAFPGVYTSISSLRSWIRENSGV